MAPPLEQVRWFVDALTYGGVTSERILAALPLADDLYCGLLLTFDSPGAPRVQFWERIDDLSAQGFVPIRSARARAICDALPRFLDRLDEAIGDRRSAIGPNADRRPSNAELGVSLC